MNITKTRIFLALILCTLFGAASTVRAADVCNIMSFTDDKQQDGYLVGLRTALDFVETGTCQDGVDFPSDGTVDLTQTYTPIGVLGGFTYGIVLYSTNPDNGSPGLAFNGYEATHNITIDATGLNYDYAVGVFSLRQPVTIKNLDLKVDDCSKAFRILDTEVIFTNVRIISTDGKNPDNDLLCGAEDLCPNDASTNNADADGDGVGDICDKCHGNPDGEDDDGDGIPNGCDVCPLGPDGPDADQDGIADACDICPNGDDNADADGDGVPNDCDACPGSDDKLDADSDGVPDGCDVCADGNDNVDTDNDGHADACDNCPNVPNPLQGPCDVGDLDSDGDGVPDNGDKCPGFDDKLDADGDGAPDACDVCADADDNLDTDGDGIPDGCDVCANGDDNLDTDSDGFADACDNCPEIANPDQADTFGDPLIGDACETPDSDGDGTPDDQDPCPQDPNNECDQPEVPDTDGDGTPDETDNCIDIANPGQSDTDGDGVGDACDPDFSENPNEGPDGVLNGGGISGCSLNTTAGSSNFFSFLLMMAPAACFALRRKK